MLENSIESITFEPPPAYPPPLIPLVELEDAPGAPPLAVVVSPKSEALPKEEIVIKSIVLVAQMII